MNLGEYLVLKPKESPEVFLHTLGGIMRGKGFFFGLSVNFFLDLLSMEKGGGGFLFRTN